MSEFSKRPRRNWWVPILIIAGLALGLTATFIGDFNTLTFNGFELHGGPIVVNRAANPVVVLLTSHWETRSITTGRWATTANNYGELHWDVFAFDAKNISRKWTTRLATIRHGQRDRDAAILGLSHNTVWMLADGLMGVSLDDGEVVGDAESIENANPQLRGMMPTNRRQIYFDNGLVLIAADGRRWRVDNETLRASVDTATVLAKTSIIGEPESRATDSLNWLPVSVTSQNHSYKSRDYIVGDTWYGMMHPSEIELQRRDPHTQNFSSGLRYRLWSTPLRDTLNRMRQPARLPLDFAPVPASPEFLYGGLLTTPDARGRNRVVGIANPTRFLVLHQDRVDAAGIQTLTCITLDGHVCWNAPLSMRVPTSFLLLSKGPAQDWALIVTGQARPRSGDKLADDAGDDVPLLARVDIADGKVTLFRFADIDLKKLGEGLTSFRRRNRKP